MCVEGEPHGLDFGIIMIWIDPRNHFDDCYFFEVDVKGLQSTRYPVLHNEDLPRTMYASELVHMPLQNSQHSVQSTSGSEYESWNISTRVFVKILYK